MALADSNYVVQPEGYVSLSMVPGGMPSYMMPGTMTAPTAQVANPQQVQPQMNYALPATSSDGASSSRKRSRSSSSTSSSSEDKKHKKHKKKVAAAHAKACDDDASNLSPAYKFLGAVHLHGKKAVLPRFQRQVLAMRIDPEFTLARTSILEDSQLDALLFILTGCLPTLCIYDLRIKTKGDLRDMMIKEFHRVKRMQPERGMGLYCDDQQPRFEECK